MTACASRSRRVLLAEQPRREKRDGTSRGALLLAFAVRDAGDVEVRPIVLLGEPRQEARRRDAAARASRDVGEVGEVAVQAFLVIVPQRHLPCTIVRVVA